MRLPEISGIGEGMGAMSEQSWYYHHDGAQNGPVSFEELQELAASGTLGIEDLVWQQGMAGWAAAGTIENLFPASPGLDDTGVTAAPDEAAAEAVQDSSVEIEPMAAGGAGVQSEHEAAPAMVAGASPASLPKARRSPGRQVRDFLPHIIIVEKLLAWLRGVVSASVLDVVDHWAKLIGNIAYAAAAVVATILFLILTIKESRWDLLVFTLAILPAALLLQYVALLFLDAGKTLIASSPTQLSSSAFLDCFGLVSFVAAVVFLCGGIVLAVGGAGFAMFAIGLGYCLVLMYLGGAALNPATVSVTVGGNGSAGTEALSILAFLLKLKLLRLVPFAFGVAASVGLLFILSLFVPLFQGSAMLSLMAMPGCGYVLATALIPFAAYLLFLMGYLVITVFQAILQVPNKLDALKG